MHAQPHRTGTGGAGRPGRGARGAALAAAILLLAAAWWSLAQPQARDAAEVPAAPLQHRPDVAASFAPAVREPIPLRAPAGPEPSSALPGPHVDVLVVDGDGQPIRGARVTCSGGAPMTALTDEAGLARVSGDPFAERGTGEVSVTASLICYRPTTAPLARSAVVRDTSVATAHAERLVLRRCATLRLILVPGEDVDIEKLFILLRSEGRLYDPELPRGETGGLGARRRSGYDWFPRLSAEEPGHDPRGRHADGTPLAAAAGEQRLYSWSEDGTRLLVGLQPLQPLYVEVAGVYGETVLAEEVTLAPEEWRDLELPAFTRQHSLDVIVRGPHGGILEDTWVLLEPSRKSFDSPIGLYPRTTSSRVEFDGLRATEVQLQVFAAGYEVRVIDHLPLEQDHTTFEVLLETAATPAR